MSLLLLFNFWQSEPLVLEGSCEVFAADSQHLATSRGYYDLTTGEAQFSYQGEVEISPDGRFVWVGEDGLYDYTSAIFSMSSGERLMEFGGYGAAFSPSGDAIAVTNFGYFDLTGDAPIFRYTFDYSGLVLASPRFTADGRYLIMRSDQDGVNIHLVETGEVMFSIPRLETLSPDESLIASDEGVYRMDTGEKLLSFDGVPTLSPDGTLLGVAGDGLYDMATGEKRISFTGVPQFSPDSQIVLVKEDAGMDYIFDAYDVNDPSGERLFRTHFAANYAVFTSDSRWLFVGDAFYEVATGNVTPGYWSAADPKNFIFSDDEQMIVVASSGLYDVESQELLFPIEGDLFPPFDEPAHFYRDESLLYVRYDGIYEVATGEKLLALGTWATFSPDENWVAVSSQEGEDYFCNVYHTDALGQ